MSSTNEQNGKKTMGWTRILLFASLAVNLMIVGIVAGAMIRHDGPPKDANSNPVLREFGYGPFGQALSGKDRRAVGREMLKRSRDIRANREDVRAQFSQLLTALRAVPYDPADVQRIADEQQNKLLERQSIGQKVLLDRISQMSDDERAAFADRLEQGLRRMRPRN